MSQAPHIVVVAGEASGDVLGGGLMTALRKERKDLTFSGVGGPQMEKAGLNAVFPMSDIAVMGFGEVLSRLRYLFAKRDDVVRHIINTNPALVICIDAPDFNHRVAKLVRKQAPHIPIIDYVTPTVWFWRPGRARKMAYYFDYGMCLLPFEPEVMASLGGPPSYYVGHRATQMVASAQEVRRFKEKYALSEDDKVLVLAPGSRRREIKDMLPLFIETVRRLRLQGTRVSVFIPTVEHVRDLIVDCLAQADGATACVLVDDDREKAALFKAADLALATSGTVALELGLAQTATIIAYQSGGIMHELIGKYVARTPSVNLVNLVLDDAVMPELLYDRLTVENLTHLATQYLYDAALNHETQRALQRFCDIMGGAGASPDQNAALFILGLNLLP